MILLMPTCHVFRKASPSPSTGDKDIDRYLTAVSHGSQSVCCLTRFQVLLEILRDPLAPRTAVEIAAEADVDLLQAKEALDDLASHNVVEKRGEVLGRRYFALRNDADEIHAATRFTRWLREKPRQMPAVLKLISIDLCDHCVEPTRLCWQRRQQFWHSLAHYLFRPGAPAEGPAPRWNGTWSGISSRDLRKVKRVAAVGAGATFVVWETVRHLFLMRGPMFLIHGISIAIETMAAVGIIAVLFKLLDLLESERRRAATLAAVTRDTHASVTDLSERLAEVVSSLEEMEKVGDLKDLHRQIHAAAHRVRRLQRAATNAPGEHAAGNVLPHHAPAPEHLSDPLSELGNYEEMTQT